MRPPDSQGASGATLVLPCERAEEWRRIRAVLERPLASLADLDIVITDLLSTAPEPKRCNFFTTVPGSSEAGDFDFQFFFQKAVPILIQLALDLPVLFANTQVPIFKCRSACEANPEPYSDCGLVRHTVVLTRRQCAALLAHSFLGTLRKPPNIEVNDFRFSVSDMFAGTAASPNSGTIFLNYFCQIARSGFPSGEVEFERVGHARGRAPWSWEGDETPLCTVQMCDGAIDSCPADTLAEFANAYIGGGVMTGDAAMEEIEFLVRPELMVGMAVQGRMCDEEAVRITGALRYSAARGYGASLEFGGDGPDLDRQPRVRICAIDAVRGGGPAMSDAGIQRDVNKARLGFHGARDVGSGHWGCGAYGNNHDLMFLKQWMAASAVGAGTLYYHDFDRRQSHNIHPLVRKLKQLTVSGLWRALSELRSGLQPFDVAGFSKRVSDVAAGKMKLRTLGAE